MRRVYGFVVVIMFVLSFVLAIRATMPTVQTGAWTPAGQMNVGRSGAVSLALPDGRVMVIGGIDANGAPTASAEFFGTDGTWSAAPAMSMPRAGHAATWLWDGEVLVTGGITISGGGPTNTAEIFDPLTNRWTTLSSTMFAARSGHTMTQLGDGSVLIAGGRGLGGAVVDTLEIFHIAPSEYFTLAGKLQTGRFGHAATALENGRVLIVGGSTLDNGNAVTLNSTEIFDLSAGAIMAGPTLTPPRTGATATTLLDGTVVIAGGSYPEGAAQGAPAELKNIDIFNPADGSLKPAAAQLAQARTGHQAFLLPHNANVLFVGGTANGSAISTAEQFTPWTGVIKSTTMNQARVDAAASPLNVENWFPANDGLMLIAGGKDASGATQPSAELFRFAAVMTDKWDYAPGDTVKITGSGWQPGEQVELSFREKPSIDTPGPFTVTADANGNFVDSEFAPDANDLHVRFYLTAVGASSGLQAQHTFTDDFNAPNPFTVTPQTGGVMHLLWTNRVGVGSGADTRIWVFRSVAGLTNASSCDVDSNFPGWNNNPPDDPVNPPVPSFWVSATDNGTQQSYDDRLSSDYHNNDLVCYRITVVRFTPGKGSQKSGTTSAHANVILTTAITIDAPTITYGQDGVVTLTVKSGTTLATGNVSLSMDSATAVSKTLTNGSAQFTSADIAGLTSPSAGDHSLSANYAAQGNFDASTATGTLTVNKADQTITFAALLDKTYGDADFTVGATATSSLPVTFSAAGQCTVTGTTVHITAAGNCTITAHQGGNDNYYAAPNVDRSFTVNRKSLTITGLTAKNKVYDGNRTAELQGTAALSGVVSGDVVSLSGAPTATFDNKNVGTGKTVTVTGYSLTGADAGNYTLASLTLTADITARSLTITVDNKTMTYGDTVPLLTGTVTGVVNGDGITVEYSTTATSSSNVGKYPITATILDPNKMLGNYDVNNTAGTLTVTKAVLTVTANNASTQYSDPLATLAASFTGFKNGDTQAVISGSPEFTTTATMTSAPATYGITVTQGTLSAQNYSFTFVAGVYTITKEDARVEYTGDLFVGVPTGTTSGPINFSASVVDFDDGYRGDIRNATVTFVDRGNGDAPLCSAQVVLVSTTDKTTGTASCTFTGSMQSSQTSNQYTIGTVVGNYYTRNASDDDTIVTISQTGSGMITGGGYVILDATTGGTLNPTPLLRNNFGFNVKYNKSGTNLQGNINTIVRSVINGVTHVYQIKGNQLQTLGVSQLTTDSKGNKSWTANCAGATIASPCRANFTGKANVQDITNPASPQSVTGSLTIQASMMDYGTGNTTSTPDTISFTVTDSSGTPVWFATTTAGSQRALTGGNLVVH